jgi:hypothetical protein
MGQYTDLVEETNKMGFFVNTLATEFDSRVLKKIDLTHDHVYSESGETTSDHYDMKELMDIHKRGLSIAVESVSRPPKTWTRGDGVKYKDSGHFLELDHGFIFGTKSADRAFEKYKNNEQLYKLLLKELKTFLKEKSTDGKLLNLSGPLGSSESVGYNLKDYYVTWDESFGAPEFAFYSKNKFKGLMQVEK